MKQAILITAYKDIDQLFDLVNFFDDDFNIYIHMDKKAKYSEKDFEVIKNIANIKLFSTKYNVFWGGFSHLKAILFLVEKAIACPDNQYFHLISGHDVPIKPISFFKNFPVLNKGSEFISFFEIPKIGWVDNGGLDRIEYYHLNDLFSIKKSIKSYTIAKRFIRLQKKLSIKRKISAKIPKLYSGSTWWSLSRSCLLYVCEYTKESIFFLNRIKYTFCSEEIYFQTVILNSTFAQHVKNYNYRYIDWKARHGNNPAILDESDYEILVNSDALFARKIDPKISAKLLDKLGLL